LLAEKILGLLFIWGILESRYLKYFRMETYPLPIQGQFGRSKNRLDMQKEQMERAAPGRR